MEDNYIKPLAHSATKYSQEQSYQLHVEGTHRLAEQNVLAMAEYAPAAISTAIRNTVLWAACYHDLGKLVPENQDVLRGLKKMNHLPVCHWDAGVAYLFERMNQAEAALLVQAHHAPGMQSLPREQERESPFRSINPNARQNTNTCLNEYLALHHQEVSILPENNGEMYLPDGLSRRLALSCIVDADYSDSAHYQKPIYEPRWEERLIKLDAYVDQIYRTNEKNLRNELRNAMYMTCHDANIENSVVYCDSPVGSGKTTAIMAYLLKIAIAKKLRHVIVVLPFTSIITQSVDIYREALTLDGENPEYVVAEHDHQADFSSFAERRLASLWNAPIVVTTAVQFFESLGSNSPARLRKLHELPGSGIFIDESHAAMPVWLWPQAWDWLKLLTSQWGCHLVLSSGTTAKFWELPKFLARQESVPSLLPQDLWKHLQDYEQKRVTLRFESTPQEGVPAFTDVNTLIKFILSKHGPRLVIMNTVYGAAYLAQQMKCQNLNVLHLSTVLTPKDRKSILSKIRDKLNDKQSMDWTLVATSCVEAGMNFSFHNNGFAQLRSAQSFLQASGRICRNGEYDCAGMYCFSLQILEIQDNPTFRTSKKVLEKMIQQNLFAMLPTELITECMRRELQEDYDIKTQAIQKYERIGDLPKVAEICVVIEDNTVMVVADAHLIAKLERGEEISPTQLIQNSVRLRAQKAVQLATINGHEDLFKLPDDGYDPEFLGYMKTLLHV